MSRYSSRSRAAAFTLVTSALATLAGCAWQGSSAPTVSYVLHATPANSASSSNATTPSSASTPISLKILPAVTAPGYDTDRILLQRADRSLDFFAASRWAAPIPRLLETLALEVWRDGGVRTFDVGASVPTTHALRLTVLRFDVDGDPRAGSAVVRVRLRGTLLAQADRSTSEFEAEASAPVGETRMAAIVAAFEIASNQALANMRAQAAPGLHVTH